MKYKIFKLTSTYSKLILFNKTELNSKINFIKTWSFT